MLLSDAPHDILLRVNTSNAAEASDNWGWDGEEEENQDDIEMMHAAKSKPMASGSPSHDHNSAPGLTLGGSVAKSDEAKPRPEVKRGNRSSARGSGGASGGRGVHGESMGILANDDLFAVRVGQSV